MKWSRHLRLWAAILAILFYVAFALLAFHYYPAGYSPVANWLSDLGSHRQNPSGAQFYNTGIILTAVFVFFFFVALSGLTIPGNKKQGAMFVLTQGFGVLGSFLLGLSGVYSIDFAELHGFSSIGLYITLGTAFAFSVAAFRYHRWWPRWLLAVGILVAAEDILSGILNQTRMMEWLTVALFLFYMGAVAVKARRA